MAAAELQQAATGPFQSHEIPDGGHRVAVFCDAQSAGGIEGRGKNQKAGIRRQESEGRGFIL